MIATKLLKRTLWHSYAQASALKSPWWRFSLSRLHTWDSCGAHCNVLLPSSCVKCHWLATAGVEKTIAKDFKPAVGSRLLGVGRNVAFLSSVHNKTHHKWSVPQFKCIVKLQKRCKRVEIVHFTTMRFHSPFMDGMAIMANELHSNSPLGLLL